MISIRELRSYLSSGIFKGFVRGGRFVKAAFDFTAEFSNLEQTPDTIEGRFIGTIDFIIYPTKILPLNIESYVAIGIDDSVVDDTNCQQVLQEIVLTALNRVNSVVWDNCNKKVSFIIVDDIDGI
jgi:hypothetical protein